MRLSKALARAGVASRRGAEELIFQGRVSVNEAVVKIPQHLVSFEKDTIVVDGEILSGEESKISYLLHKPKNFLCSSVRVGRKRLVIDLFPSSKRLYTIGRLDFETTGLILVTNDGAFSHQVIHPSSNIEKEYLVKTREEITPEHLEVLSQGARVEEKWVRPLSVQKVRRGTFKVIVKEGKKHEIRCFARRANLTVVELARIRIGGLVLGSLQPGEYRILTDRDKRLLLQ